MNAKDWLDYGALGMAGFFVFATVGGAFAFTKWVMTQAFSVMKQANASYAEIANIARGIQQNERHDKPALPVQADEAGSGEQPPADPQA